VSAYALACYGGAGGQHACLVADALGMTKVLFHPLSGVLSAYGMGLADIRASRQRAVEEPLAKESLAALATAIRELGQETQEEVAGQGVPAARIAILPRLHLRYAGT